jgi:hypothetical protein
LIAVVFFFLAQTESAADSINMFEPRNILKFADHMFEQKDYPTALGEYKRYVFMGDSQPEYIASHIIECLTNLKKFDEALEEAEHFQNSAQQYYTKGMIYYLAMSYDSSRSYLVRTDPPYTDRARKIMGLGYAEEFNFQKASEYIHLPLPGPQHKSPVLGGILSLVPGAGHFYSGRFSDGIYALVIVGAASALSWYYYDRDENIKFGFCLGAAILFYAGNIYGGINAARNYNFYQDLTYLEKIKETVK